MGASPKGERMSLLDRFRPLTIEEKDSIRQEIIDNCDLVADCWVYKGTVTSSGYGMKYIQGKMRTVSRFMLAYTRRESLDMEADACHDVSQCPHRACCNPHHLDWGTHAENAVQRERYEAESRQSRLLELPQWPQPAPGHETHEEHAVRSVDAHGYHLAQEPTP